MVKGVTSAIQTQINARLKGISSVGNGTAVTGGTGNTFCKEVLVPANTFTTGDAINIITRVNKAGIAGNLTLRIYANTSSGTLAGGILLGTSAALPNTTLTTSLSRVLGIEVAAGTGNGTTATNTTLGGSTDFGAYTTAAANLAINWTVDQYIQVAIQNGNSGDSSNCNVIKIN